MPSSWEDILRSNGAGVSDKFPLLSQKLSDVIQFPPEKVPTTRVPVQQALNARSTANDITGAFDPTDRPLQKAAKAAGQEYYNNINEQLDALAPSLRAVDREKSIWHDIAGSVPQMQTRMRQHDLGLMDMMRAAGGAAAASKIPVVGKPVGFALGLASSMADRSPRAAYLTYRGSQAIPGIMSKVGSLGENLSNIGSYMGGIPTTAYSYPGMALQNSNQ